MTTVVIVVIGHKIYNPETLVIKGITFAWSTWQRLS